MSDQELYDILARYVSYFKTNFYIFVCSDDYQLECRLVKQFNLLSYNDESKTFNNLSGVQKAIVDLYLLSSCQIILGTKGSSFSYFAWMLSNDTTLYEVHS